MILFIIVFEKAYIRSLRCSFPKRSLEDELPYHDGLSCGTIYKSIHISYMFPRSYSQEACIKWWCTPTEDLIEVVGLDIRTEEQLVEWNHGGRVNHTCRSNKKGGKGRTCHRFFLSLCEGGYQKSHMNWNITFQIRTRRIDDMDMEESWSICMVSTRISRAQPIGGISHIFPHGVRIICGPTMEEAITW